MNSHGNRHSKRLEALEAKLAPRPAVMPESFYDDLRRVYGDGDGAQPDERLTKEQIEDRIAEIYNDGDRTTDLGAGNTPS